MFIHQHKESFQVHSQLHPQIARERAADRAVRALRAQQKRGQWRPPPRPARPAPRRPVAPRHQGR
jgi:hypothetical protein